MKIAVSAMNIAPITSTLTRVTGRDNTVSTQIATIARMIVAPVRSCSTLRPSPIASRVYTVSATAITMPAGTAKLSERRRNPGT